LGATLGGLGMTAELVEEAGVVLPDRHQVEIGEVAGDAGDVRMVRPERLRLSP
jgi:hypothetical protein